MTNPKLYIGTLSCGENEFQECLERIQAQTYRNFEHFVIENLPNKEAHQKLFGDFLSRPEFGILIKIDADLVLRETTFFQRVVDYFKANPDVDLAEFVVYDFMERVVNLSLNCYRQGFGIVDKGEVYVDRITDIPKERRRIVDYVSALHCPNSSEYQAFHFGYHAQLKNKVETVRNTLRSYLLTLNRQRGLAVCGALEVMAGRLGIENIHRYRDPGIERRLEDYSAMSGVRLAGSAVRGYAYWSARRFAKRAANYVKRMVFSS